MFVVNSSRLVCSALRLLCTLAESTVFRAFPLRLRQHCETREAINIVETERRQAKDQRIIGGSWFEREKECVNWVVKRSKSLAQPSRVLP